MKRIWKYELELEDMCEQWMPIGAQVLTVQAIENKLFAWAIVDTEAVRERRYFQIIGTGNPFPGIIGAYVGTAQVFGGAMVFHVFVDKQ